MSDYDTFAEIYDVDMGAKKDDIPMYRKFARDIGDPILESGCGTGRIVLPLAQLGYEIWGIDNSPQMLEVARKKLRTEVESVKNKVKLIEADMCNFELAQSFKLAILTYNTFTLLLSREEQESALKQIWNHLQDNGRLITDLFVPRERNFERSRYQPPRYDPIKSRTFIRIDHIKHDPVNQIQQIEYDYDYISDEGEIQRTTKNLHMRYLFPSEMELLLEKNGYQIEEKLGGYDGKRYDYYSGKIIFVATKNEP